MPDGVVQWFDPATGDGAVVRGGRVFAAAASDVETVARNDAVVVTWPPLESDRPGPEVRSRIAHGQLAEQWFGEAAEPARMAAGGTAGATPMEVATHGAVDDGALDYARHRVGDLIDQIDEPVLFARVKLTVAGDPARERPAIAQATIDIDGDLVRAHVAAHELREAVDLLQRRLRDRLEHRAAHRRALRRSSGIPEPGEWRHGDLPEHRPDFFDRPREERQLVRHKTFAVDELTPDEAAYDMSQAGYDFHLFRDLASGQDAVLERLPDGSFQLTSLDPSTIEPGPTAISLTVAAHPPATATVSDAIELLDEASEPFVFFANATTGRGNVVYRRYDGHYGLVTPE